MGDLLERARAFFRAMLSMSDSEQVGQSVDSEFEEWSGFVAVEQRGQILRGLGAVGREGRGVGLERGCWGEQ